MKGLKSSLQRLYKSVCGSREQWKEKAKERHRIIRAQGVKIRDLEKSRAQWKEKAKALQAEQDKLAQAEMEAEAEAEAKDTTAERVSEGEWLPAAAGHHHDVSTIQLGLQVLLLSSSSLRGTAQILALVSAWLPLTDVHFTTLRQWAYRFGLWVLQQPLERRSDWILVIDHTVESGPQSGLVILAISQPALAAKDYRVDHRDMHVIDLAPMTHATGEQVHQRLEAVAQEIGVPLQIVADHGSDVKKGIELFQAAHPETIYTYDVSHALANLLKQELGHDGRWQSFLSTASQARQQVQQTELAFLAPPKPRTKARFMSTETHLRWAQRVLAYHDQGDFSTIDPRYSINWPVRQALSAVLGASAEAAISDIHGQPFADRASFRKALLERLSEAQVRRLEESIFPLANRGERRFQEKLAWLLAYRDELTEYGALVDRLQSAQTHLKHHGLHRNSPRDIVEQHWKNQPPSTPRVARFSERILAHVEEQASLVPPKKTLLPSSDILESVFGKYKTFTEHNPIKEIGKRLLLIPALVTQVTAEQVQKAMESIRNIDVQQWAQETCGKSQLAKRVEAFSALKKNAKTV